MGRLTDRPEMAIAVDWDVKKKKSHVLKHTKKNSKQLLMTPFSYELL